MSCKAPGWTPNGSESDIDLTLGESAIQEEASSNLDYEEAYEKLERMKQRVLQMKTIILQTMPTGSANGIEPIPNRIESDSNRLREVQLETSQTSLQVDAVKSRLKESSEELSSLAAQIYGSECCANKLAKQLEAVPEWMEEQRHHVGVCLERYQELNATCCSQIDYSTQMSRIKMSLKKRLAARIPLKCYKRDYMRMSGSLGQTRQMLHQTREKLTSYLQGLEESLTSEKPTPKRPSPSEMAVLLEPNQDNLQHSIHGLIPFSERHHWTLPQPRAPPKPLLTAKTPKGIYPLG